MFLPNLSLLAWETLKSFYETKAMFRPVENIFFYLIYTFKFLKYI